MIRTVSRVLTFTGVSCGRPSILCSIWLCVTVCLTLGLRCELKWANILSLRNRRQLSPTCVVLVCTAWLRVPLLTCEIESVMLTVGSRLCVQSVRLRTIRLLSTETRPAVTQVVILFRLALIRVSVARSLLFLVGDR